jgi:hypothetical protein
MKRLILGSVVLAMAGLMLFAGPASANSSALSGAPTVGQCYAVSGRTANAMELAGHTVSCSRRHTLWVINAREVPASVIADQGNGAVTARTEDYFLKICMPSVRTWLGTLGPRLARSSYEPYWFFPTKAEQRAGSHWMSCELAIADGKNALLTTTVRTPRKVTGRLPVRLRLCGTARFYTTNCAAEHAYRSSYAFAVDERYGPTRGRNAADDVCPSHVRSTHWMATSGPVSTTRFLVGCLTQTTAA